MQGYRGLCIAAVTQNWRALQLASEKMKGDHELCMEAIANSLDVSCRASALQWASEELKGDRELCMAAIALYWKTL